MRILKIDVPDHHRFDAAKAGPWGMLQVADRPGPSVKFTHVRAPSHSLVRRLAAVALAGRQAPE